MLKHITESFVDRFLRIFQRIAYGDRHRKAVMRSAKTSGSGIITDGVYKNFACGHFIASCDGIPNRLV